MRRYFALAAAVCLVVVAAPQPAAQVVGSELTGPEGKQVLRAFAYSSAATAVPMIVGGTMWASTDRTTQIVGVGIATVGLVVGPSVGTLSVNDRRRALNGILIRSAGAAAFAAGFGLGFLHESEGSAGTIALSSGLISVSAIMLSYGFAFNFMSMSDSVREARVQVAASYDRESRQVMPALVVRF